VRICWVLPCPSFQSLATPQGACSAQKRPANPAKDAPKIALHLLNPRGRTCTARSQFSAPLTVVKQYHVAGNTVVNSYLKIWNNDDGDFAPEMTFFRTLKFFREFGMCMGWLWLVGSIKPWVFFAKELYKTDYILPKRPRILSILLIAATP